MKPLSHLSPHEAGGVEVVLTDIDDTLTTDGRLTADAYAALERLQEAGLKVIPVTGRPAGWCDLIARFWPVDGVVGENGAFYFRYDHGCRRMLRRFWASAGERAANRKRLDELGAAILAKVPGAALAADQAYRVADLAIDFCEDVAPLSASQIDAIVDLFEEAGATAKVSSIHVNGWFGKYDKLTMTREMLRDVFGFDPDRDRERFLFVGDSPNDEPLFQAFPLSVGVANVLRARSRLTHLPGYVTASEAGAGFVEVADRLLGLRMRLEPKPQPTRAAC
jgi:HAD superfamily hydrolase (TIGR01484 family)